MTDNVISFKQAKKRAGYTQKELVAAENRAKFGRNKSKKRSDEFDKTQQRNHVDGHKLDE